ncbi:hypothetical protein [Pendulispora albinea]|uniref:Uncharacterized protein n=1 Tax=Pendulispora albinea TaxID=2741071 RepID=A0ABZ2MA08_9BACT
MLARTHWPALLHDLARRIEEAHRELGLHVRVEAFDDDYELSVRIPRAATRATNEAKEA